MHHLHLNLILTDLVLVFILMISFGVTAAEEENYLWPVRINDLWGYMNARSEIVIPAQFNSVELFHEGRAVVHSQVGDGLIDLHGAYLIEPQPGLIIEESRYAYDVSVDDRTAYGFYDKKSGFYQAPTSDYRMVMLWNEDGCGPIAVMNSDGLTGYVSRTDGHVVIPFQFTGESDAPAFSEGYALGTNAMVEMDETGEMHEVLPNEVPYDDGFFGAEWKNYLIDTNGHRVSFPDGIEPASGVSNGTVIISSKLTEEDLIDEDEHYFAKFGIAKADGTIVVPPMKVYYMWEMGEDGLICFVSHGCCGQMTATGEIVIPAVYPVSTGGGMPGFWFANGYAVVSLDGYTQYKILKPDGKVIAEFDPQGENWGIRVSGVMKNNRIWVESWHNASEVVNNVRHFKTDHTTIKLYAIENDELSLVSDRSYEAVSAGIQGVPCQTDDFSEELQAVKMNGLWGFIDQDGTEIIPFVWDAAGSFDHGLAFVQKDDKLRYINHSGVVVWQEE